MARMLKNLPIAVGDYYVYTPCDDREKTLRVDSLFTHDRMKMVSMVDIKNNQRLYWREHFIGSFPLRKLSEEEVFQILVEG